MFTVHQKQTFDTLQQHLQSLGGVHQTAENLHHALASLRNKRGGITHDELQNATLQAAELKRSIAFVADSISATLAGTQAPPDPGSGAEKPPAKQGHLALKLIPWDGSEVLATPDNQALYTYSGDKPPDLSLWSPFNITTTAIPPAGVKGVNMADDPTNRDKRVVTYEGLHTWAFSHDKPGEVTGDGSYGNTWHAVRVVKDPLPDTKSEEKKPKKDTNPPLSPLPLPHDPAQKLQAVGDKKLPAKS